MDTWEVEPFQWTPVVKTVAREMSDAGLLEQAKRNVTQYNRAHHPISREVRDGILEASAQGVDHCTIPAIRLSDADELALRKAGFRVTRTSGCRDWVVTVDGAKRSVSENMYLISWEDRKGLYI